MQKGRRWVFGLSELSAWLLRADRLQPCALSGALWYHTQNWQFRGRRKGLSALQIPLELRWILDGWKNPPTGLLTRLQGQRSREGCPPLTFSRKVSLAKREVPVFRSSRLTAHVLLELIPTHSDIWPKRLISNYLLGSLFRGRFLYKNQFPQRHLWDFFCRLPSFNHDDLISIPGKNHTLQRERGLHFKADFWVCFLAKIE